jgi:hypothetical protein
MQASAAGSHSSLCLFSVLFSRTYTIIAYKFYNLNSRCKCLRKAPASAKEKVETLHLRRIRREKMKQENGTET